MSVREMSSREVPSRSRIFGWLGASMLAFPVVGLGCLVLASYGASATGIGLYDREIVAGVQTATWGVLMSVIVLGLGRATVGALNPLGAVDVGLSAVGLVIATMLAYLTFATTRAGGVLDVDAVGVAIWLPGLVLATVCAHVGARTAPRGMTLPWQVARLVAAVAAASLAAFAAFA